MNTSRLLSTVIVTSLFVSANASAQDEPKTPPPPPPAAVQITPQIKPLPTQPPNVTPASIWWGKDFDIPQKPSKRWYGWQTLAIMAAGDLTAIASYQNIRLDVAPLGLVLGISTHALAGPIVHWAHGHVGRGFASFGLNAGFTAIGIVGGLAAGSRSDILAIGIVGYFIGPILDVAFLSTEPTREPFLPMAAHSGLPVTNFGIVPIVDANQRGLLFVGQF